uniref:J domain-containing protein n=1 Tax=Arcella intermedia TaxID=1963864 RepID=A0A6B2L908_9EUKA
MSGPGCYLELLGVPQEASPDHIRKAYKEKCLLLHPDKNRNHPGAAEAFRYINQAYTELMNPSSSQKVQPLHRTGGINVYQNTTSEQYKTYDKLCQSLLQKLNEDAKNGCEGSFSTQCINEYVFQTSTTKVYEPVETELGTFCRNKKPRLSYAYQSSDIKPTSTTTTHSFFYTSQASPEHPDPYPKRKRPRPPDFSTPHPPSASTINASVSSRVDINGSGGGGAGDVYQLLNSANIPLDSQTQYLLSTFGCNVFQSKNTHGSLAKNPRKREAKASLPGLQTKPPVPSAHPSHPYQSVGFQYYSYQFHYQTPQVFSQQSKPPGNPKPTIPAPKRGSL